MGLPQARSLDAGLFVGPDPITYSSLSQAKCAGKCTSILTVDPLRDT